MGKWGWPVAVQEAAAGRKARYRTVLARLLHGGRRRRFESSPGHVGRHESKEPRRNAFGRVTTRRADAVQRLAAGKGNANTFQAQEANALRLADDKFSDIRRIRKS